LLADGAATNNTLHIYKIVDSGFRVRVDPGEELSKFRYDILHDDLIVDSNKILTREDIKRKTDGTKEILTSELSNIVVTINSNPFVITFTRDDTSFLELNADNFMFVEDGSPADDETFEGFKETFPNGKTAVGMSFAFQPSSARITGFTEGNNALNIPDTKEERRYARDGYSLYGNVPLFFAHGDGMKINPAVFWINPSDMLFSIETQEKARNVKLLSEGGFIDFVVFIEELPTVIKQYTYLTGVQAFPPAFTLGYHQSKWGYPSQVFVEEVLENLTINQIPHDVTWLDIDHLEERRPFTTGKEWFYNDTKMFNDAKEQHRIIIRIADPHMFINDTYPQYVEANESGYFVQYNGENFVASSWPGQCSWPDYLRKEVRDWWMKQFDNPEMFPDSVFIWNDMNEIAAWESMEGTVPKDAKQLNNTVEVREVHNIYGLSMVEGTHRALVKRGTGRTFLLTRSFFAGAQKYAWHWSGDNSGTWEHLRFSIDTLLSSNLNGMPYTGSDVGGFNTNTTAQLLARWYQVGAYLYPLFREHCMETSSYREPYLYKDSDPEAFQAMKDAVYKRYEFLPLFYTAEYEASKYSIPFAAPLWYHYPGQGFDDVTYQPVIGGKFMVVPVLEKDQKQLSIVKPPGRWYEHRTGKELTEDENVTVSLNDTFAFFRGGNVTASFSKVGMTVYDTFQNPITIHIALDENNNAKGMIYFDDLQSEKYKSGEFLMVNVEYSQSVIKIIPEGNTSFNQKADKILIYGLKEAPNFRIPGSSVSFDDGIVHINDLNIDLTKPLTIETGLSTTVKVVIAVISIVFGIAIIALFVFVGYKYMHHTDEGGLLLNDNYQKTT
jgi:alpha 1,3-glucosidase